MNTKKATTGGNSFQRGKHAVGEQMHPFFSIILWVAKIDHIRHAVFRSDNQLQVGLIHWKMRFANESETAKQQFVYVQGFLADSVRPILFVKCDNVLPCVTNFKFAKVIF
jgi:hypothetical protein